MSTVHPIYRIDDVADPLTIPPRPISTASLRFRDGEAVYSGDICTANFIGTIRDDVETGCVVAMTRGNADSPADIARFPMRAAAIRWLRTAVNGVIPPQPRRRVRA